MSRDTCTDIVVVTTSSHCPPSFHDSQTQSSLQRLKCPVLFSQPSLQWSKVMWQNPDPRDWGKYTWGNLGQDFSFSLVQKRTSWEEASPCFEIVAWGCDAWGFKSILRPQREDQDVILCFLIRNMHLVFLHCSWNTAPKTHNFLYKGHRNILYYLSSWNSSRTIRVKSVSFTIYDKPLLIISEFMLMWWLLESPLEDWSLLQGNQHGL